MKLSELYRNNYSKVPYIGIFETDERGEAKPIYPDFADEMLETHGNKEVIDYAYSQKNKTLVVELKNERGETE